MAQIKTENQYKAACSRIEELLKVVGNDTPSNDKSFLELDLISDLVADYEEEHYLVTVPSLKLIINFITHVFYCAKNQTDRLVW